MKTLQIVGIEMFVDEQHGFTNNTRLYTTNLLGLIDNNSHIGLLVLLISHSVDFAKAFNTISHNKL